MDASFYPVWWLRLQSRDRTYRSYPNQEPFYCPVSDWNQKPAAEQHWYIYSAFLPTYIKDCPVSNNVGLFARCSYSKHIPTHVCKLHTFLCIFFCRKIVETLYFVVVSLCGNVILGFQNISLLCISPKGLEEVHIMAYNATLSTMYLHLLFNISSM